MRFEVRHGDELLATFDDREFADGVVDKIRGYGEGVGKQENIRVVEIPEPHTYISMTAVVELPPLSCLPASRTPSSHAWAGVRWS